MPLPTWVPGALSTLREGIGTRHQQLSMARARSAPSRPFGWSFAGGGPPGRHGARRLSQPSCQDPEGPVCESFRHMRVQGLLKGPEMMGEAFIHKSPRSRVLRHLSSPRSGQSTGARKPSFRDHADRKRRLFSSVLGKGPAFDRNLPSRS